MPPPTTYTADELKAFLVLKFEDVFDMMGWDESAPVMEYVVNAAVRGSDVATIAEVQDAARLELVAEHAMWITVASNLVTRHDQQTPSGNYAMSKLYDHAVAQEQRSRDALVAYDTAHPTDVGNTVAVVQMYDLVRPTSYSTPQRYWWDGERNY